MPRRPVDPNTNQPISSLHDFDRAADRLARQAAGLPEYAMDDPERPFTEEYDTPAPVADPVAETESQPTDLDFKLARILERVHTKEAGRLAVTDTTEREDPWSDLGGGINTYRQEGKLPAGHVEDARTHVTRGRGGKLVTRVELSGRFLDVPVVDGPGRGSNNFAVDKAKEQLAHGIGTPVAKLHRKPKK